MKRFLVWFVGAGLVATLVTAAFLRSGPTRVPVLPFVQEAQAGPHAPVHGPSNGCSNRTVKGVYGFSFSGSAVISPFEGKPGAVVGLMTFDGKGNLTAVVTANAGGAVLRKDVEGTYSVNDDCTGSVTAAAIPVPLLTFSADAVIVNGGTEVLFIGTIAELVFNGIAKKL